MSSTVIAGMFAAVIPAYAYLPYIRDILRGNAMPHRVSWLIWSIVYTVIIAKELSSSLQSSSLLVIVNGIVAYYIFYLSLKRGIGSFGKLQTGLLVSVMIGVVLSAFVLNPFHSILTMITINASAATFTLAKTYKYPWSESAAFWFAHATGSMFSIYAATTDPSATLLAYPIYAFVGSGVITLIILTRRRLLSERIQVSQD